MGPVATVSSPQRNVELTTAPAIPAAAAPTIAFSRPQLENLFAPDGVMNHRLPGYEYRPAQVEMMRYITEAFLKDQFLLVEAPPGVGKSMAYLLPAVMFAKARREKVVVSTYTLSLQNQLLEKDIPQLRAILSVPFEAVTLKGRQQYICRRLVDFFKRRANLSDDEVTTLVKLLIWLQETKTGEIGELALTREDRPILRRLVSDYHTCADKKCEVYRDCFIKAARRRAKAADIIIVNHALLLREPKFETEPVLLTKRLIIDEAHELETAATDAYGQSLTREMFDQWQRSLIYPKKKGGLLDFFPFRRQAEYLAALNHLKQITRQLGEDVVLFWGLVGIFAKRYQEASAYQRYEVSLTEILREQREWKQVNAAAEKLLAKIHQLLALLTEVADCLDDRKRPMQSAGEKEWLWEARSTIREGEQLARLVTEMFLSPRAEQIYWITVHREIDFVVRAAPRRVSEVLRTDLYAGKKSLVMTSATLSTLRRDESGEVNPSFDYFRDRLGLEGFRFERVADVFDYKKQALIYLPLDMVEPQSAKYASCLSKVIVQTALALGGRTLVLFTSYGGIKSAYEQVAEPLKKARIDVFAQGVTGGKMKLLQQFRSAPRGVLLGTATFWQGVDLPGEKLSCLIMAKLPFDVPTEPVFKARRAEYDDGFIDYAVPLAILRFRQGFGRLIRTKTDRGVMIIMDNRVEKSNFGLMFLRSLPECEVKYGLLADAAEMTKNWLANPKNKS
jgi:DNA polymerase-3 subunit epsilon/ATP-dependent DNA helicase DinG